MRTFKQPNLALFVVQLWNNSRRAETKRVLPAETLGRDTMTEIKNPLSAWTLRDDVQVIATHKATATILGAHALGSKCYKNARPESANRDRAWIEQAIADELESEANGTPRTVYFCERCVVEKIATKKTPATETKATKKAPATKEPVDETLPVTFGEMTDDRLHPVPPRKTRPARKARKLASV